MSRTAVTYTSLLLKCRGLLDLCLPDGALSHVPGGSHAPISFRRFLSRHLIPARSEWVRIQNGLASGLWIHIDIANERTWWLGTHEPATQEAIRQALGPDKVMYDIGAHIGFYTLPAARLGAEVIAFEPDPENTARIRAHIDRNGLGGRVQVVEAAVWSSSFSSITFRRGLPRSQGGVTWQGHRPVLASGEVIEVATVCLDNFVASGGPAPHIIKVDVEGSESEVLKGAINILCKYHPVLIVEVHTMKEHVTVSRILENIGYTARWGIPPEGFPRQCVAMHSNPST